MTTGSVKKTLPGVLGHPRQPAVGLRLANLADRETLRSWKNANRQFFFLQEEITQAQQEKWFEGYLARADDHQYMIEETIAGKSTVVGVLACRLLEAQVDVYNVMRGRRTEANLANMGEALEILCAAIRVHYPGLPITCKVLDKNPAVDWYERLGFVRQEHASNYFLLRYEGKGLT